MAIEFDNNGNPIHINNVLSMQGCGFPSNNILDKFYAYSFNKNRVFNDAFGYLQQFSSVDFKNVKGIWPDDILAVPSFEGFAELTDRRIVELTDKYHHLTILWSGGCDSCAMVTSLIRNQIPKHKYEILFNQGSIEEAPNFYQFMVKQGLTLHELGDTPIYDYLNTDKSDTQYVNGCPEQIFSYPIMSQRGNAHFWKHWSNGVIDNLRERVDVSDQERKELLDILDGYLKYLGLDKEIAYTVDLYYLIILSGAWIFIPSMFESFLSVDSQYRHKHTDFFLTNYFARWALHNQLHHIKHENWFDYGDNVYRVREKQYIATVFDDKELWEKTKKGSQTREHDRYNNNIKMISIYHDQGVFFTYNQYHEQARRLITKHEYLNN